jgi:CRP-like cAMP-binding protein
VKAFLELSETLPRRELAAGEALIAAGTAPGVLHVLLAGSLLVERNGEPVASISEAGACIGEIGLLLNVPATADVVASEPSTVATFDDARALLDARPDLSLELATMLAARLQHMTTYLADLQQQYADHEGGLGMVGTVLGTLMHRPGARTELSSARDPEPEY